MKKISFCLIAFESTHDAIKTEKAIKAEVAVELIPTPREISASCGLSIKFHPDSVECVRKIVQSLGEERKRLYEMTYYNGCRTVKALEWEV